MHLHRATPHFHVSLAFISSLKWKASILRAGFEIQTFETKMCKPTRGGKKIYGENISQKY
jgi:hypothetical protein